MRWRIAILVLAVIGIAGAVYVGMQPRKGTADWHEREYWALRTQDELSADQVARMKAHEAELLQRGRLAERTILVSNNSPARVYLSLVSNLANLALSGSNVLVSRDTIVDVNIPATNAIRLVTSTNNVSRLACLEELIRRVDVPESE